MSLPQFNEINGLSNVEISDAIIKAEKELFNLKFKKATRQPFKSHEIKFTKRRLAQLKTVLTLRLNALEQTNKINAFNYFLLSCSLMGAHPLKDFVGLLSEIASESAEALEFSSRVGLLRIFNKKESLEKATLRGYFQSNN